MGAQTRKLSYVDFSLAVFGFCHLYHNIVMIAILITYIAHNSFPHIVQLLSLEIFVGFEFFFYIYAPFYIEFKKLYFLSFHFSSKNN